MTQQVVETLPLPTEKILTDLQKSILPLLESIESSSNTDGELYKYESAIGSLVVLRHHDSLEVRASEPWKKTPSPDEFDILPIRIETQFSKLPDGKIEASPIFEGRSLVVFMLAQNAHFSGRYVPYNWRDGGTSLESERFGSLPHGDILRLRQFMNSIIGEVTAAVVLPPIENEAAA